MTPIQTPRVRLLLPDIREPTPDHLAGHEPGARGVTDWHHSLKTHDEGEVAVNADEFDCSLERRKIDDSAAYKGVEVTAASNHYPVVRRVYGELIRPELLERWNVTIESRDSLTRIENAVCAFTGQLLG